MLFKGFGVVLKTVVIITDIEVIHLDIDVAFICTKFIV